MEQKKKNLGEKSNSQEEVKSSEMILEDNIQPQKIKSICKNKQLEIISES